MRAYNMEVRSQKKKGLGRKEWVHDHKTPQVVLEAQELSAPCCYAQIPDTQLSLSLWQQKADDDHVVSGSCMLAYSH